MTNKEKRIIRVSEMINEHFLLALLDFRQPQCCTGNYIWNGRSSAKAQEILAPNLEHLSEYYMSVLRAHDLHSDLFNAIEQIKTKTAYTVGMIAGLHLAGRNDLLPQFASAYSQSQKDDLYEQYDNKGKRVISKCES